MKMLFILDWRSNSKGIKIPATNRMLIRIKKRILIITMTVHDPILLTVHFTKAIQSRTLFHHLKTIISNSNFSASGSILVQESTPTISSNDSASYQTFELFFLQKWVRSQHYFSHKNSIR